MCVLLAAAIGRTCFLVPRKKSDALCPDVTVLQNVVKRVVALPLVRATCTAVSGVYNSAKDKHPLLGSACRLAEHCVCSVTSCALDHAQPLLEHLHPQCESESLPQSPPWPVVCLYHPQNQVSLSGLFTVLPHPSLLKNFLSQGFAL